MNQGSTIIIRRRRRAKGKHHSGGGWKVAFADFTLAMMALFMVLWLMEASSPSQRKAIARYFAAPGVFEDNASNQPIMMDGPLIPEMRDVQLPEFKNKPYGIGSTGAYYIDPEFGEILKALQTSPNRHLDPQKIENLRLEQLPFGVRIELTESKDKGMFGRAGSAQLEPYFEDLLLALSPYIEKIGRAVIIRGHADALQFSKNKGRDNWDLSSDRAQAARRTLVFGGLSEDRIINVAGMGDRSLLDKDDPYNPVNRRIEILLLNEQSEMLLQDMLGRGNRASIDPANITRAKELATENQI